MTVTFNKVIGIVVFLVVLAIVIPKQTNAAAEYWKQVDSAWGRPTTYEHEEPNGRLVMINSGNGMAIVFVPKGGPEKQ